MPSFDRTQLERIGNQDLPYLAARLDEVNKHVSDATRDWAAPFAEVPPDGFLYVFKDTKDDWIKARSACQSVLTDSAANIRTSAQAVLKMAQNYLRMEEDGVERLRRVERLFG